MEVGDVYPKTANDWQAKGWKDQSRWGFLGELDPGHEGMARAASKDGMARVDSIQA